VSKDRNEVVEMRERRTSREEGETSDEGQTSDEEMEEEEIITASQAHEVPPEQEIDGNTSGGPQLKGREGRDQQLWALSCRKLKEELEQIGQPKTGNKGVLVARILTAEFETRAKAEKWRAVELNSREWHSSILVQMFKVQVHTLVQKYHEHQKHSKERLPVPKILRGVLQTTRAAANCDEPPNNLERT
jgi:hypothetical protein